ncbi:MAG TPA: hypothetical protein VGE34_00695 [Candidatus Saccharimonadales bacterium]
MTKEQIKPNQSETDDRPYQKPLGFIQSILASYRIRKFRDYVKLSAWAHIDSEERENLKKRYEKFFAKDKVKIKLVQEEIDKIFIPVFHSLKLINAPLEWVTSKVDDVYDEEKEKYVKKNITRKYNIVVDMACLNLPRMTSSKFAILDHILIQAEAQYARAWKRYLFLIFNPIWIIARILRIPIGVMERMGVDTRNRHINKLVYWFIQAIVLIALTVVAIQLGIKPELSIFK